MKVCSKCNIEKDESEFSKDKTHKDGFASLCKSCKLDNWERWRKNNEIRYLKYHKEYRKNNRDKIIEWRINNKDKLRELHKVYNQKNSSKRKVAFKKWVEKNRGYSKKYYWKNPVKARLMVKKSREKNITKALDTQRRYRLDNKEILLDKNRKRRINLHYSYIKAILKATTGAEITNKDLIEIKRQIILLKRKIKNYGKEKKIDQQPS